MQEESKYTASDGKLPRTLGYGSGHRAYRAPSSAFLPSLKVQTRNGALHMSVKSPTTEPFPSLQATVMT